MMPREVNVWTSKWKATGVNVSVPQYEQEIRVDWVDDAGMAHTKTETVRFPNILSTFSAAQVKDIVYDLMLRELKQRANVEATR